jgi:hypothetical protein
MSRSGGSSALPHLKKKHDNMMKSYINSARRDTAGSSLQVDTLTLAKAQASNEAPINWGIFWN